MRTTFRHGIVSHQGSLTENFFLRSNVSGGTATIGIVANIRPITLTIAHGDKNYTFVENYSISNAWFISPHDYYNQQYWLYWDFDLLTFERTFKYTTLEPVIQSSEPGSGNVDIVDTIVGNNGTGGFVLQGEYVYLPGRKFSVINSTCGSSTLEIVDTIAGTGGTGGFVVQGSYPYPAGTSFTVSGNVTENNGTFVVTSTVYNAAAQLYGATTIYVQQTVVDSTTDGQALFPPLRPNNNYQFTTTASEYNAFLGTTTIYVSQQVIDASADGRLTADVDSLGNPLLVDGRMWYDTAHHRQYVLNGTVWVEVLRVLAAEYQQNHFISPSVYSSTSTFIGTQIGDTHTGISGTVLFNDAGKPIRKDDRTFYTTEDQFFSNNVSVTAIRLESNVVRAQSTVSAIAAFTPVAWIGEGRIEPAEYDDTGSTVIGLLLENVSYNEVGPIVIQGVVTNPNWDWLNTYNSALQRNAAVGDPLWIDQGQLVPVDPHLADPVTYRFPRVPCARVLARDTVVFDQGLGGKGEKGPPGTVTNLPIATTTNYGVVILSDYAGDDVDPVVIVEGDPRLEDCRCPTPHTHQATEISYLSTGGFGAANVQLAIDKLIDVKLNLSGGTMTGPGFLTLHADPVQNMHAATKQYVDGKVVGLIWLDPLDVTNALGDNVGDPTAIDNPGYGDGYIIPGSATSSSSGTGIGQIGTPGVDFTPFIGHIVEYQGTDGKSTATRIGDTGWWSTYDINQEVLSHDVRIGIAHEANVAFSPSGSFANQQGKIYIIPQNSSGVTIGFTNALQGIVSQYYTPIQNDAYFIHNESSWHYGESKTFTGVYNQPTHGVDSDNKWLQIGSLQTLAPGDNLVQVGNRLNVVNFSDGGTIDSRYWQGWTPTTFVSNVLDLRYAPLVHTHVFNAGNLSITPYTSSIAGLGGWTSTTIQTYAQEVFDKKANLTPFYANPAALPVAATVHGMIAHINSEGKMAFSYGGNWVRLSNDGHNHDGVYAPLVHTHNFPYDMAYFIAGVMQPTTTVGSFAITRNVTVPAGATGSVAKADIAATGSASLNITVNGSVVGTIGFSPGGSVGTINLPNALNLVSGDLLQIKTQTIIDATLKDISVTIVGCTVATNCTM